MSDILHRIRQHSVSDGDRPALIIDDRTISYGELASDITAVGERLRSLVSDAEEASDEITVVQSSDKRMAILIHVSDIYSQILYWLAALHGRYIPIVCHNEVSHEYMNQLKALLREKTFTEAVDFGVLTSGTSGAPKPLWRRESSWSRFFDIQNGVFHIDKEARLFLHGSFSFTGISNMGIAVLWAGGAIVVSRHFSIKAWVKLITAHQVSHVYLLPTKLRLLVRYCNISLPSVNYIIAGSQLIDRELMNGLRTLSSQMRFILYYGASELNYISHCYGEDWLRKPGTVGTPFPRVRVSEHKGLLYIETEYAVEGVQGATTVGDKGYIDEDGYIIFQGRDGDNINRGGYKIPVLPLEQKLQELPEIEEVAAVSVPDDMRGEELILFVVPQGDRTSEDIENAVKRAISPAERPKSIHLVQAMPLTDCSKVDKRKLKEWYNK